MSRVKNKNTDIELLVRSGLKKRKVSFKANYKAIPGSPDVAFPSQKVAVFIDGDFWHGYRFFTWEHKISLFWRKKIALNKKRDLNNFRKIRKMGWIPIRVWQHELENDFKKSVNKILKIVKSKKNHRKIIDGAQRV